LSTRCVKPVDNFAIISCFQGFFRLDMARISLISPVRRHKRIGRVRRTSSYDDGPEEARSNPLKCGGTAGKRANERSKGSALNG
jgi:hypothetical protein